MGRLVILMFLGLMAGIAHSWARPVTLGLKPPPNAGASDATAQQPDTPEATPEADAHHGLGITLERAYELFQSGEADFIDAREPHEYEQSRILGAFNIAPTSFQDSMPDAVQYLDKARALVVYCGGGDCHASESVAIYLQNLGYPTTYILGDGFPAWQAAGHPTEDGGGGG